MTEVTTIAMAYWYTLKPGLRYVLGAFCLVLVAYSCGILEINSHR